MSNKKGDLRVWWVPQMPCKAFHVPVKSVDEAVLVLTTLANYDLFQLENNIKGDFCNAGGLNVFDDRDCGDHEDEDGWTDWYDDEGNDIDDVIMARTA